MIVALLATAAAAPMTAVDAERAFAARAQQVGQWTAFREFAEPTAVMFTPQAAWAQVQLKDAKDPPVSVQWWPSRSFVSCDGDMAVNTGPWKRPKSVGYFTTVWTRQKDGSWKWSVDSGDTLSRPLSVPARPAVRTASCRNLKRVPKSYEASTPATADIAGQPPADAGQGRSADGTLTWAWSVTKDGARRFDAKLWNGRRYETVLAQRVAAPKK